MCVNDTLRKRERRAVVADPRKQEWIRPSRSDFNAPGRSQKLQVLAELKYQCVQTKMQNQMKV